MAAGKRAQGCLKPGDGALDRALVAILRMADGAIDDDRDAVRFAFRRRPKRPHRDQRILGSVVRR